MTTVKFDMSTYQWTLDQQRMREQEVIQRAEYYVGWHLHRLSGMSCNCINETQLAGWNARQDNENWALLVADALKLKVRS